MNQSEQKSEKKAPKPLIIVESETKVRTLSRFLGKNYQIKASGGHIRDLPREWLGLEVENGFEPQYQLLPQKRAIVRELKAAVERMSELAGSPEVYLASDPDREGEAIAWHLSKVLKLPAPRRIEFNEITEGAVKGALETPKEIDMNRVNAQQARRIMDRLVGYYLSPLLWDKVLSGLSAGRVQSVALRMVCEREREIEAFVPEEYWTITALLRPEGEKETFEANLVLKAGEKIHIGNEEEAQGIVQSLEQATYRVEKVAEKKRKRSPSPPFITSTMQQQASSRLRFSPSRTMFFAQQLYEGVDLGPEGSVGLITYLRTDSVRVAKEAAQAARKFITREFGSKFVPPRPPRYKSKPTAQEAHEAIRPTSVERTPDSLKSLLKEGQLKLYELIWRRFLASQMNPALLKTTTIDIAAHDCLFRANGTKILFQGFLAVAVEEVEEKELPSLSEGQALELVELKPEQHFTEPPPRYNDASLIKALENNGIGRPSTYAPILQTLRQRDYVTMESRRFVPTELGFKVNDLLVEFFPQIINVDFTANMESELDEVEKGREEWRQTLSEFYEQFEPLVAEAGKKAESQKPKPIPTEEICPECSKNLVIRVGRFGKFYGCSGFPECRFTRPVPEEGKVCPKCGSGLALRKGKTGAFYGCIAYPECDYTEPVAKQRTGKPKSEPIGVPCPQEGCEGEVMRRRAKGRTFYGCSNYPNCRFTSQRRPLAAFCPECGSFLVADSRKKMARCSSKGCRYSVALSALESEEVSGGKR